LYSTLSSLSLDDDVSSEVPAPDCIVPGDFLPGSYIPALLFGMLSPSGCLQLKGLDDIG
jgi:hypothetical protein